MEMNFASKGVAGAGLGLGIAGTALGLLGGGLRNVLGGGTPPPACQESHSSHGSDAATLAIVSSFMNSMGGIAARCSDHDTTVSRYEAAQSARIAELETEVKLRDANTYTDGKILDLYRYVDGKFACVESQISAQAVYNATNTATLSCLNGQVNALMALTKTVIPITNVCPEPMARFNSWTAPAAPTTAG